MENLLFTGAMEIQIFLLNLELYIKQKLLTNAIWGKTSAILVWASLKFARTKVANTLNCVDVLPNIRKIFGHIINYLLTFFLH